MTKKPKKARPPRDQLTSPTVPPIVGEMVVLWSGARHASKVHGVPMYLDGHTATVVEVLANGRFRIELDRFDLTLLPKESRSRVIRLDEISGNLGDPKDWRVDESDA